MLEETCVFPTRPELYRGCFVRHFKHEFEDPERLIKNPNQYVYQIFGIGLHTETNEKLVIYVSQHNGEIFCRPLDQFVSEVDHKKYPQVKQKYRLEICKQY